MKLLYNILGKDVTHIILDYHYRLDIEKLNKEYHEKFEYYGDQNYILSSNGYLRYKPTNYILNFINPKFRG